MEIFLLEIKIFVLAASVVKTMVVTQGVIRVPGELGFLDSIYSGESFVFCFIDGSDQYNRLKICFFAFQA